MEKRPISADSHVTEPPHCYIDHIESRFRERAPRLEHLEGKGDVFIVDGFEDQPVPMGLVAAAGKDPKDITIGGVRFEELHRGGWDPEYRLQDQDRDGLAAEFLYATVGMLVCSHPDLDYRKACLEAYNRWLQEYCSYAPNRLFGLGQAAIKSPQDGIKELIKIKEMGFKGVMMAGAPGESDYDDPIYDRLWQTAVELDLPLSIHTLTSGGREFRVRGPKINGWHGIIRACQDIIGMLIYSGVFERHPDLRVVSVEADAGWAPHFMYRMDHTYQRHRYWMKIDEMQRLPSDYFRENIYLTFQDDSIAFRVTDLCNVRRLMWANDFPHSDSCWPDSQNLLAEHTRGLSERDRNLIVHDNVVELYKVNID